MILSAKEVRGLHSAVNALTKGFWAYCDLAPHVGKYARLECSTGLLEEFQQRGQFIQWGSSSPAQGSCADPHAYLPRIPHHSDSSGTEVARSLNCLPWRHRHQRNPALGAVKGFLEPASSRRSYTYASFSCSPGPSTAIRPHLGQPDKTRSLSAGNLQDQIAEANSILQVRLSGHLNHMKPRNKKVACRIMPHTSPHLCASSQRHINASYDSNARPSAEALTQPIAIVALLLQPYRRHTLCVSTPCGMPHQELDCMLTISGHTNADSGCTALQNGMLTVSAHTVQTVDAVLFRIAC